jgi:heat shock protein HslJ
VKKYIPFLLILVIILSACATQAASLTGAWKLTAFGPVESPTPAVADAEAALTFNDDGTVTGSSGCNSLSGEYTVQDNQITFSALTSTLMACDDARNAQESAVMQVLTSTAQFEIETQTLTITNNGMVLVFTSVPME